MLSYDELEKAGLTLSAIDSYFTSNTPLQQIKTTPKLYMELHHYILSTHQKYSKTTIGNLYKMIDPEHSSTRPDNVYRKIEKLCQNTSSTSPASSTSTTPASSTTRSNSTTPPLSGHYCKHAVDRRDKRHKALQRKFKDVEHSLNQSERTVAAIQSELTQTKCKLDSANKTTTELQALLSNLLEDHHREVSTLADDNRELQCTIEAMERELLDSTQQSLACNGEKEFTVKTKEGTRYLNSVRELYYNLLTKGIAPDLIDGVIRTVLSKLSPMLDISSLKLPKRSCANYMRMAEMPTISDVHKVTNLTNTKKGHINSDGTTLNMKKLIGSSVNGTVLGVQEVSDGTSETMINELDRQLAHLRDTANELHIPNANSIKLDFDCVFNFRWSSYPNQI